MDTSQPFFPDAQMLSWSTSTPDAFENQLLSESHVNNRYGALQCGTFLSQQALFLFYNMSSYHEVPLETANYYNSYLSKVGLPRSLTLSNEPMPKTTQQEAMQTSMYALMIACIIMIPFTFIPSTFVGWIVKERECKARHLQNVSGLSFYIYWVSNFVFDLACYIITMFLVIAVFGIFQRKEYIEGVNLAATVVLFFMYGLSGILMAYAVNFIFNSHSTAQNVVMLANFIIGFLLVLAISALQMTDSTKDVAKVLRWIFRIVPSYCVGEGISNLATLQLERAFGSSKTAFHMDCIGWVCVYMAIEIPVFAFITLFVDHPGRRQRAQRMFHNPNGEPEVIDDEDPDVVAEREAVNSGERDGDLVSVHNLRKEYSNGKVAVRNITFGVKPGEVFGFLGTNGAGKTTTISILCQEFYPTAGHASICGHDIVSDSQSALRCIGYCPQFDACIDLLTVEEHLYLYAGVRGITSNTRENVVEGLLKLCELVNYRKTKSHELSGGNRRKLSVAISLIGGPRVVFLDEPSAGMDPVARRGLWTAIETVADNCSVVLTTHHLEEVEALAHRVAIMVDGILHCIGDKTHLKQKFGTGFEVTVRVPDDKSYVDDLEKFFDHEFPSSEALENRAGRLTFQLPNTVRLSTVFTLLEEHKERLSIIDYNVSQTSIEQVFMRISEEAEAKQEAEFHEKNNEKKGCCGCCC
ncbi:ATP-binding protein cassette protein subfamily A, member 8 [Angomonas deanei]|uniref:ABC-2 family transporter protein/ABC transporter/AAA domain, putative AbiEii toxin, Type IV TA system, putative n=1 Tax=Angomonas deanei TaxID=59799 RepID=A0A7G2C8Z8_9TRYP|nr:ATP-binding protein cassette protein subfamily A, member 8 [Angomonas deanei]CAD2215521.1 ABC-2 family transporter protein/ABC transporter/AAA domain, putative AbiEii toxin, Type IV TA system, putative [Angomonas deanei]|eukprot:EPY34869.1 ATP-binding protein cassette protein subfamily A, member 8 [Angomonas deanei]